MCCAHLFFLLWAYWSWNLETEASERWNITTGWPLVVVVSWWVGLSTHTTSTTCHPTSPTPRHPATHPHPFLLCSHSTGGSGSTGSLLHFLKGQVFKGFKRHAPPPPTVYLVCRNRSSSVHIPIAPFFFGPTWDGKILANKAQDKCWSKGLIFKCNWLFWVETKKTTVLLRCLWIILYRNSTIVSFPGTSLPRQPHMIWPAEWQQQLLPATAWGGGCSPPTGGTSRTSPHTGTSGHPTGGEYSHPTVVLQICSRGFRAVLF